MAKTSKAKAYRDNDKNGVAKKVRDLMYIYEYAYSQYLPTLERLQKLSNAHDNVFDTALFPTISKMPIPSLFSMVEEALPAALDYVWPDSQKTYSVMPIDSEIDIERLDDIEWALNYMVRQKMRAKYATIPIIRNGIKLNLGYGAVVPYVVTPPATINKRFIRAGEDLGGIQTVGVGQPQKSLRIEHVGPGEIIPMDDGVDFNGPERVSIAFRVKMYNADAFRRLFKKLKADTEDVDVSGDAEALIAEAKDLNFTTNSDLPTMIAELGGYDLSARATSYEAVEPLIPVVQCYGEHEHVWIANGTTIIRHVKDKVQTLHTPLLKASVTMDMHKWHPMGPSEAGQYIAAGKNLYTNLLMDFIIRAVKPYMVYDRDKFGDRPPVPGVNGEIGISGNVGDSIAFPTSPQLNNGHLAFDENLNRLYGHAVGQSANISEPTPGLLRGGLHAFEQLLNTTSGRQRLANMILEMGFVEPLGNMTMLYMQLMAGDQGFRFTDREYDSETGQDKMKYVTITHDDINSALEVSVDARDKQRTVTNFNERFQEFNALLNSPYVDQYYNHQRFVGDYNVSKRMLLSRQRVREIQEQQRQIEQQRAQGAGNNAPGGTPESIVAGALTGGA